jgi:hypothetical protein
MSLVSQRFRGGSKLDLQNALVGPGHPKADRRLHLAPCRSKDIPRNAGFALIGGEGVVDLKGKWEERGVPVAD